MDLDKVLRLKGALEAAAGYQGTLPAARGEAESYARLRHEVLLAAGELEEEFARVFPETLDSSGKAWTHQGREAKVLMAEMAGWLSGVVETQLLERRIRLEADIADRPT